MTWLIITLSALFLSALFSGTEIAFVTSDRVRTELDVQRGGIIGHILQLFYKHSKFFISTILVGNNIVLVVYGMGAAQYIEPWLEQICPSDAFVLAMQTLVSTLVILLVGEFFPKAFFRINPNRSLKLVALPMAVFYFLLYPISQFATWLSRLIMRILGQRDADPAIGVLSLGDLSDYIEQSIDEQERKADAPAVENEVKIFHNALDFSTIHLRDCMTPRNEIVAVDVEATTRDQLSALFTQSGRSKILVYSDDIDNVVGYIHVSELFIPDSDWKDHVKPVIFAPESQLANKMMRRLLAERRSVAVIIDEFGGTAGMVTLEDLVEEIFGDIQDEHDKSGLVQSEVAPGVYEFSGRSEIESINENFHLDIPEDDEYQTLAGYILFTTGTIPPKGTVLHLGDLTFEILKKSASRLELIRVSRGAEAENA